MAVVYHESRHIYLFVILLLSICLRFSNADGKYGTTSTDEDLTRPEVTILPGTVRGVNLSTRNNRSISGFLGIPFAEPPLGSLRFKPPVPASAWNETLDAGSDTADCPQLLLSTGEVVGNEDCLYTNVYTPLLPDEDSELLPVMMYIHGGGNIIGGNNSTVSGPGYLLDKDVVLVVPSYRLGALGFLSTGDAESPGNWGLKDLVLALEWIRDNIEFFGGDPNRVTIVGNSAGSMAITYLSLSNLTTGLIHGYISQSSLGLSPLGYQPSEASIDLAFRLGEYLECPTETSALLVECLRISNVADILDTTPQFIEWEIYPRVTWAPTIEPDLEGAVMTDTPVNLLASGKIDDLPGIVGSIPGDGIVLTGYFYAYPEKFEEFLAGFDNYLPYVLNYYNRVKNVSAYTTALKSYYFNNDLTTNRTILLSNLTQLCSDFIARFPDYEALQQFSANNSTYLYSFEYRGTFSYSYLWAYGLTTNLGAAHCDELIYLFPEPAELFGAPNETMSENDFEIVETMVELWTSFATTGEPVSTALDCNKPWSPYSAASMIDLRIGIGADVSLEVGYFEPADRVRFLETLETYSV